MPTIKLKNVQVGTYLYIFLKFLLFVIREDNKIDLLKNVYFLLIYSSLFKYLYFWNCASSITHRIYIGLSFVPVLMACPNVPDTVFYNE